MVMVSVATHQNPTARCGACTGVMVSRIRRCPCVDGWVQDGHHWAVVVTVKHHMRHLWPHPVVAWSQSRWEPDRRSLA